MQERVYKLPIRDATELCQRLVETWSGFQQSEVDYAIDQWCRRLEACVQTQGGHFEQLIRRGILLP